MKEKQKKELSEYHISIGLYFGTAFDNVRLGICLGLVFGVAM